MKRKFKWFAASCVLEVFLVFYSLIGLVSSVTDGTRNFWQYTLALAVILGVFMAGYS